MVGGIAVMTFFAISGYLVSQSWQTQPQLLPFVLKRALRIWPALAVVVVLSTLVLGAFFTSLSYKAYFKHQGTWDYLANTWFQIHYPLPGVFANNPLANAVNGSLWTIPIEVTCYVVLAAAGIVGLLKNRGIWAACCLAYLTWFLFNMTLDLTGSMHHIWEFPAYFVFGSLIAALGHRFLQWRWHFTGLAAVIAAACYLAGFSYSALLIFLPPMLISVGSSSWPLLSQAGRFGDLSYGAYLYAFPIQQSIYALWPGLSFGSNLAVVTLLTLVAAWLSWHFVEAPALRLKRYLR